VGRGGRYDFGGQMLMWAVLTAFFAAGSVWLWRALSDGPRISQPAQAPRGERH
jgi:hypothetical protein